LAARDIMKMKNEGYRRIFGLVIESQKTGQGVRIHCHPASHHYGDHLNPRPKDVRLLAVPVSVSGNLLEQNWPLIERDIG
jgi:hypothetical protein